MTSTKKTGQPENRDLTVTGTIDVPRDRVFKAWTDPKSVAQWWGPTNFTNPVCEMDVRPGGIYRIHSRGPDGSIYPIKGRYDEIVENERIVFTNSVDIKPKPIGDTRWTVSFEDRDRKTFVIVNISARTPADREKLSKWSWRQGTLEMLDRLADALRSS